MIMNKIELLIKLKENMGYVEEDDLELLEEIFSKDFEVGVKYYSTEREKLTIEAFSKLSDEKLEDIKNVFILAQNISMISEKLQEIV